MSRIAEALSEIADAIRGGDPGTELADTKEIQEIHHRIDVLESKLRSLESSVRLLTADPPGMVELKERVVALEKGQAGDRT